MHCNRAKPERTHHCYQCDCCVVKMYHHCNWMCNCVGYHNYKFYFLSILYGVLMKLLFLGTFWECLLVTLTDESNSNFLCFYVLFLYSLVLLIGANMLRLLVANVGMVWGNFTTIEWYDDSGKKSPFSRGVLKNVRDALGSNFLTWFCPLNHRKKEENN